MNNKQNKLDQENIERELKTFTIAKNLQNQIRKVINTGYELNYESEMVNRFLINLLVEKLAVMTNKYEESEREIQILRKQKQNEIPLTSISP